MNKSEFIFELKKQLSGLPDEDIQKAIQYYSEMIDDRIEDGLSEEEAVAAIGSIKDIVSQILSETPLTRIVKERVKPSKALGIWAIVLIVLGAPVWLPILLSLLATLLAVYIVIWAVIIVLYSAVLCVALGAIAAFICIFATLFSKHFALAFLFLGATLICAGFTALLFIGFNQVTKGILFLSKKALTGIKGWFIGKEKL